MYQQHWKKYHKGVCSINFYGKTNSKILGLTGFRLGDYIITDDQVFKLNDQNLVKIRFYEEDGHKIFKEYKYSFREFNELLPMKKEFDNLGFAYFKLPSEHLVGTESFELCQRCNNPIGRAAFTISYQFDQNSIALKSSITSTIFINERGLTIIQFDGNMKIGTSGSPLIDYEGGKVFGIVTNKELQIVKTYNEILNTVDKNLRILEKVKDKWTIENVDPIQVLMINQLQIKHLSKEFFSNFALKDGFALDANHLREHLESYNYTDEEK